MAMDWPAFLSPDTLWTILVAIVTNASCALVGCYLVLRRMSLLGDAISHATIAGIAAVYLLTGTTALLPMLAGALAAGLLTAVLTQSLRTLGNVPEDSSMGLVFTSLFAFGAIVVSQVNIHLDADCVLYGKLEQVPLDVAHLGGWRVPAALPRLVPVLVLTLAVVLLFWKELKIASFDPALASAMGLSAAVLHFLLMGTVALVTVASLESLGAILVVAMLIVPAATAHLLTERLWSMLVCAVAVGAVAAVLGCLAARWFNTIAAGMMAVVMGLEFLLAVLLAPRHGLVAKAAAKWRLGVRIASEDVVAFLFRHEERAAADPALAPVTRQECVQAAGGGVRAHAAVSRTKRRRLVQPAGRGQLALTEQGRELGRTLVRSHRLWEAFLDQHFQLPADHLHEPAERIEHYIGPQLQDRLARELDRPERDPHGSTIPPETAGDAP